MNGTKMYWMDRQLRNHDNPCTALEVSEYAFIRACLSFMGADAKIYFWRDGQSARIEDIRNVQEEGDSIYYLNEPEFLEDLSLLLENRQLILRQVCNAIELTEANQKIYISGDFETIQMQPSKICEQITRSLQM